MFIGRRTELKFFEQRYATSAGELVVLYGRRRVGKTETLREFCKDKPHVFFSCTECTDDLQLRNFSERMLSKGIPAAKYLTAFSNWQQALESVQELPGDQKKLLVIDEFPYMVKANPSIPSILQNLWDGGLREKNVMIILCGSAMSFIEKEILAEKNPLYGRATGLLKMNEMGFYDAISFFPAYCPGDQVTVYTVLGGIPHYLKQFDDSASIRENILRNILTRGSILYSEVEFLMHQELRETTVYNTIIEAVALGNTKLNDIHIKTLIEKSKLSVYLRNLVDLGIVRREFPVSDGVKERSNIQRGLYQLTDNFFRFWYTFVFPNISELETGDADGIYRHVVGPALDQYASRIFEDICREYLREHNRQERLPFHFTKIGSWWDKRSELDIMATNREKNRFLLGECKYKASPFNRADMASAMEKFKPSKKAAQVSYYFFSKSGFSPEVRQAAGKDIHLVELEAVVRREL